MKAIIINEFGSANVLTYCECPKPTIAKGEVLIRTTYTSVNFADIKNRTGNKAKANFPMILGLDIAGTVEEFFGNNSEFQKGDQVIAFPKNGAYAEYVVAKEQLVFKIPQDVPREKVAAVPTVLFLSYMLTHQVAAITEQDTVLIHAASGGVGTMLIQMAKRLGAKQILGTVSQLEKAAIAYQLGAHQVFTYDDFSTSINNYTNGHGVDIIFDSIAGAITEESLHCLASYGTLVQFGNSGGRAGSINTSDLHSSCRNIKGFSLGTTRAKSPAMLQQVAQAIFAIVKEESFQVPISKIFSLEEMQQAHELMESRQHQGKILIKI
ncbi:zinc-binding dehydrogenase [Lysinibacillus macroides]|uniref:Quinone oxidoreductase n=1 Tax=Lysinibacillus macroides TaxID=33935 RepID=A0A0N0CXA9_9BACI|nr:zinc-binding dehydrogenase [Lysinibacillus macroides]KOY84167.1 quinone oxidoreductase [Lysinibacillus macroides]QPR66942.1 zinc-binding dehydrogenase [Lysinibacillus macroides]